MKLLFCADCHDLVKITGAVRRCECGQSAARRPDQSEARVVVTGPALVWGTGDAHVVAALRRWEASRASTELPLYLLPEPARTVERVEELE